MKGDISWLIVGLRVAQAVIAALLGLLLGEQAMLPGVDPGSVVLPDLAAAVAKLFAS